MYKTEQLKIDTCTKCAGTGKLRIGNSRENHNSDIEECPYCFGDGSIVIHTIIEHFRKDSVLLEKLIPRT